MNEDLFKSFEFKRQITSPPIIQPAKKMKTFDYDLNMFVNPNILAFYITDHALNKYNFQWILTNPIGSIIYNDDIYGHEVSSDYIQTFLTLYNHAIQNKCSIITHEKENMCQKLQKKFRIELSNTKKIFCMTASISRYGLIRLDGKRKIPNAKEIYKIMYECEWESTNTCSCIANSYIKGRLKGWWLRYIKINIHIF